MSFIITVYTNEGIIMASDSRTTYTTTLTLQDGSIEKRIGTQVTDSTYKTFICNKRIGISTCGAADINGKPIAGFIERFIVEKTNDESTVPEIANGLLSYFSMFNPKPAVNFIIAGYNPDNQQCVNRVFVASNKVLSVDTTFAGTSWDGETEVFQKIIKNTAMINDDGTYYNYPIRNVGYNYFTLQDAIDFAEYAVDVTIKTMYFQDYVNTVGGPIDILAIKPSGAFWIRRKELHA